MKKILQIFTLLALTLSCSNKTNIKSDAPKKFVPYGTMKVAENVYIDKTEITNIDYKEYLYWIDRIYGDDSNAYKNALPNNKVWLSAPKKYHKREKDYFRNPKYDHYTLVGVTEAQVIQFTKWRTDRVAQAILIKLGVVEFTYNETIDNHFTIERYLKGTFPWAKEQLPELILPVYALPTEAEFKLYDSKVKSKFLIKNREGHKPEYTKGFWSIARFQKFTVE